MTPQIIIKIVLKSKIWINNKVMSSADADVLVNSVGPNQTAYTVKSLIWVCNNRPICPNNSKFTIYLWIFVKNESS